jgi:hypothetical protein
MRKAQGLSLNYVIVGIIALVVLVVVILIFAGGLNPFPSVVSEMQFNQYVARCREQGGQADTECAGNQLLKVGSVSYNNQRYICCKDSGQVNTDIGRLGWGESCDKDGSPLDICGEPYRCEYNPDENAYFCRYSS